MAHDVAIGFTSDRFDHQSSLPDEYNAGNRFYGKDVAEWLVDRLGAEGLACTRFDEDWGWMVSSARGSTPVFDIAIYNLSDHREGGRPGVNRWGLSVSAHELTKRLGITRRTATEVPGTVLDAITRAITSIGAEPYPWDDESDE